MAVFRKVFGKTPDEETLAEALASFVLRLLYGGTAMDRFRSGKVFVLTSDERAGMWIFRSKAGCWCCHHGFNFTDERFHNTGVDAAEGRSEARQMTQTGDPADAGAFKTPALRGLLETPPYFHDGSVAILREVIEFYNRGGESKQILMTKSKPSISPDTRSICSGRFWARCRIRKQTENLMIAQSSS